MSVIAKFTGGGFHLDLRILPLQHSMSSCLCTSLEQLLAQKQAGMLASCKHTNWCICICMQGISTKLTLSDYVLTQGLAATCSGKICSAEALILAKASYRCSLLMLRPGTVTVFRLQPDHVKASCSRQHAGDV